MVILKAIQKVRFTIWRGFLAAIRPLIGNRNFTKKYTNLLANCGLDIEKYDTCGFIAPSVAFDKYGFERIHIKNNVFLTHDVILLVHDQSAVTVYNSEKSPLNTGTFYNVKDIYIGNNVFIGMRSIVLPGSVIGDNVVIGAGSIVRGNLDSGFVYAGNPVKKIAPISYQFIKLKECGAFNE